MPARDPRTLFSALMAGVAARTSSEKRLIDRLSSLLERTAALESAAKSAARVLPTERVAFTENASALSDRDAVSEFRVFRRETPLASASALDTVPAWARGAAVAETIGPLRSDDGRLFWYDFYRVVRLVPVYFAGDTQPAFLFHLRERTFSLAESIDVNFILPLLLSRTYMLERGSVWIRASLLSSSAPAQSYIGLTVRGGSLTFRPSIAVQDGRLTIPVGGQCSIHLDLMAPAAPAFAGGSTGKDAADAALELPDTVDFTLVDGRAAVAALANARWTLYGQSIAFTRDAVAKPSWEPAINCVLLPYNTSEPRFSVSTVQSPFATPSGAAPIERAGWALPAAQIDVAQPNEAAGIGGLAVRTSEGISIDWRGLRDGPVKLSKPWISLAPGLIVVTDIAAAGAQSTQRLRLWQESAPPGRSTIDLRFARPGALTYAVSTTGNEVLFARADTNAQLDRPVDVRGAPFSIHTLRSQLSLAYSDTTRWVGLYDEDMLSDALSKDADWNIDKRGKSALAIRNALFSVTPINSLLLFGSLRDDEMLRNATIMLGFGLYSLLPTLPDPYAANVGRLHAGRFKRDTRPTQLLVCSIAWDKAAVDEDPDVIKTGFSFAPMGTQAESIAAWVIANANPRANEVEPAAAPTRAMETQPYMFNRRPLVEPVWQNLFERFEQEQFSLLDVSSNADQMGVSFAFFQPEQRDERRLPFTEAYGDGAPAPASALEIRELDLSAQGRYVRAFALPQVSWEPLINLTQPHRSGDPPEDRLLFPNDGGPTRLLSNSTTIVPIAPIPATNQWVEGFAKSTAKFTGALFTLPYGLRAFAEITSNNQFPTGLPGAKLSQNRPQFESGAIVGAIQLRADAPPQTTESALFRGCTAQMENLHRSDGNPTFTGTLGASVGTIFNQEFFLDGSTRVRNRGVPLTRIDFSGYGASIFSHWEAPNAAIASTSQARFDVFVGRTAHEVIQVRTLMYPWGIHVVRTITLLRASSGYTYRWDSGWQPESDGLFDFSYRVKTPAENIEPRPSPYNIHPGVVHGVFNVRNIRETDAVKPFTGNLSKANGETYIDQDNYERVVDGFTPNEERNPGVELQAVYFDGDFKLDGVIAGATGGFVPSKGILGFVQLAPRGEPLTRNALRDLLIAQLGSIGAFVACELNIAGSGQRLRVSRIDVSPSVEPDGVTPLFVVAARGAVVLPKGGAWSVVRHNQGTGEVTPLDANATVPLIRRGLLTSPAIHATNATPNDLFRLANPIDLVRVPGADSRHFGFLQTTGTQKVLFRQPSFQDGVKQLLGATPDFADAFRLINTKGIFPNVQDAVPLALGAFKTRILDEGYKLLDELNPAAVLQKIMPPGPLKLIDESYLKIYVEYQFAANPKLGTATRPSVLNFSLDSAAAEGKKWLSNLGDIGLVVDLGPIKRLVTIKGNFDAKHAEAAAFRKPELVFAKELQPVVDILTVLSELQGGDYAKAMEKGLDVAMSNSAESWSYAFHARKQFPVVRFPPGEAYYAPQTPLKLEAHFAIGAYFNESLSPTTDVKQLLPTAGAYLEFGGSLSVMCVSVAAATVYAVGAVDLRIYGDTKAGPGLAMKFGFGAEIVVGLPVVGNVSLLYMVGVDVSIDLSQITVSAFLLFRGRAELLGGIVCITIQIEARGSYQRIEGPPAETNMIAQVTFAIDISIFLIINLHFSQSWQEQRQIA